MEVLYDIAKLFERTQSCTECQSTGNQESKSEGSAEIYLIMVISISLLAGGSIGFCTAKHGLNTLRAA